MFCVRCAYSTYGLHDIICDKVTVYQVNVIWFVGVSTEYGEIIVYVKYRFSTESFYLYDIVVYVYYCWYAFVHGMLSTQYTCVDR